MEVTMNIQPLELLNRMEVTKRKNGVLQEMAKVMFHMHDTPMHFWVEVINTTCYTTNKVFLRPKTKKHHMNSGMRENLTSTILGNECYILRDGENLGKFYSKYDLGIFLGYSNKSKTYGVYNQNSKVI